jgi:hypothetical protein
MRKVLFLPLCVLLLVPAFAQETQEHREKYPFFLFAHTSQAGGGQTRGEATLHDRTTKADREIHYICEGNRMNVAPPQESYIDSKASKYFARLKEGKQHELRVEGRKLGSDTTHEFTCKF